MRALCMQKLVWFLQNIVPPNLLILHKLQSALWQQGKSSTPLPQWSSTQDKGAFLLMTTAGFVLASTKNFTQRLNHH